MPRPRLIDRPVDKKLSLRTSVVQEIDSQLADKLTGKPRYGAWTELVESLLSAWACGEITLPHHKPKVVDLGDLLKPKEETLDVPLFLRNPPRRKCSSCHGAGVIGTPGLRCHFCDGEGSLVIENPPPNQ